MSISPFSSNTPEILPGAQAARQIASSLPQHSSDNTRDVQEEKLTALMAQVEFRLISAAWTLRRLPSKDTGYLKMRGMMWPDTPAQAGDYAAADMTAMQARRAARISATDVDQMQPALDLLQLLPDVADRKLVFWAAWHQDGERQAKIPWARVRRSMDSSLSRWTLKRRYENSLKWLSSIILAQ